jgi:hypothetical protein
MSRFTLFLAMLLLVASYTSLSAQSNKTLEPFLGTWALTLPHNGSNDAGWLEVKQENGYIAASLLWYGGSVTPADHAFLQGQDLVITKINQREIDGGQQLSVTTWTKMHLEGDILNGVRYEPSTDGQMTKRESFKGVKLPADPPKPNLSTLIYGAPIKLLATNSLDGWRLTNEYRTNGWSIQEGVLVNDPVQPDHDHHISYGNLRTDAEFEDFNLKLEVNIPAENNSGIYLRGIYEIQVFDSYGKDLDSHNMGGLYSRITPAMAAEKPAGEWQSFDITLVNRHVTVILNGKKIIDNQPVRGCTGGALTSNEFIPGPIYLQGDHGKVSYRNIVLTPIIH